MKPRIAIVTDDPGWHGRRLREAFAQRGVDSSYVSLLDARFDLSGHVHVALPGFGGALPDAVFVRGVPGGSLQQVVFHLNVLHALKDLGVPVYNDGRAIERSVDKSLTSLRLRQKGLPTPATWVCSDLEYARDLVRREAGHEWPLICKPLFGSQGQGIRLVHSMDQLPNAAAVDNVWYLQRFVGDVREAARDWRVFVVAGRAVAAMRRTAPGWLANVAQGAECHAVLPDGELKRLAEDASAVLDMAYAGVDLMRDGRGQWWLIEVNSIPAWKGLQAVSRFDIAGCLADDLMRRCPASRLMSAVS